MPTVQGKVPLFDVNRGWKHWEINQRYTGPTGVGEYVPNVNDLITDVVNRKMFIVVSVDQATGISTLADWNYYQSTENLTDEDVMLGVGPGYTSEMWRVYIDDSVIPHGLTVDPVLKVPGSANTHFKVFKGTDINELTGQVISAWFDQNGAYVSENIPLELAQDVEGNVSTKVCRPGYSTARLQDGEVVTVVIYNSVGGAAGFYKMLVKNTKYVRSLEASQRYIENISIRTPFMSLVETDTLEVPLNVPLSGVAMMGVVHYSDGSTLERPIDGTKFILHGIEAYHPTIHGQPLPIVLTYLLSSNEATVDASGGVSAHISKPYQVRTVGVQGSYSVKLFVAPNWISDIVGWRLEYFLYDLDRQDFYYATPYVEGAVNSRPFNPLEYNTTQRLNVSVNLKSVDSRLADFRHSQVFDIALYGNGVEDRTPWILNYAPGQPPTYGTDLSARFVFQSVENWTVDVSCGCQTVTDWLHKTYFPIQPLFDPRTETVAPYPTHFVLEVNGIRTEYPIADFDRLLPSITGGQVGRAASLEWLRKVGSSVLRLGHSPLVIVHTN